MTVHLGINPITWTNDDMPELGGDIPLETCLAETREAGYSGTELGGKFPRTSSALRPILERHHLKLVSGWFDGRILERDVAEEFAAITPTPRGGKAFRRSRSARRWRTMTGRPMAAR
jgi:inosose dehydratase